MSCGKLPNGAALHDGERVQLEPLRAGRLLLDGVLGDLRVVRAGGIGRHLLVGPVGAGSAEPVRRPGRRDVRHRRLVQRQRRLPEVRRRHDLRRRDLHRRRRRVTPNATCNASGTCVTPANISCAPYACGTGACKTTCADEHRLQRRALRLHGDDLRHRDERLRPARDARADATDRSGHAGLQAVQQRHDADPAVGADAALLVHARHAPSAQTACVRLRHASGAAPTSRCRSSAVSPAKTNADYYLQVGFAAAAGSLAAGGEHAATSRPGSTRTTSATTTRPTTTRTTASTCVHDDDQGDRLPPRRARLRHRAAVARARRRAVGRRGARAAPRAAYALAISIVTRFGANARSACRLRDCHCASGSLRKRMR